MTDKLPPLSTPIVLPTQPPFTLLAAANPQHAIRKQEIVEEEPYTIKCICGYAEDDGNTIYCEKCDTWQHIECYYPNNLADALREDFAHACADCEPRPLDRQRAIERQRQRTTAVRVVAEESADKKPKRPPSKSHKKKPKPTDLQLNGQHGSGDHTKHASPHEHANPHPPKKTKSSHKPSQSISSQAPKRSPPYGNGRVTHGHPPSPATTPPDLPDDYEIHGYSSGFMSLYNERSAQIVRVNSFAELGVSNRISEWLRDPEMMQKETGLTYGDVFQTLPEKGLKGIPLEIELVKRDLSPALTLQWQCLKAPSAIGKDIPLMELNGQIGFQANYCADLENRWDEFTSPLPFVLFHPLLPLYIDTRREGSDARFVRRSCRPNAILETYLSARQEYHFWLVSDRQIAAKEQITIPWDFRLPKKDKARMLRILGLGDDDANAHDEPLVDDAEYRKIATWVHLVLSEYGGCACDLGQDCAFAQFHRNYYGRVMARASAPKSKKRKPKAQHAISPTSTGHATNSRAPSEGHTEDVVEHDGRSVSGSSRSKPPSRDLTPTARQGSFDTLGILTEPTDRDKRKVTMIEDSFRRMEQQQHHHHHHHQQQQHQQPPRKRKRVSDGTSTTKAKSTKSNSANNTPTLPHGFPERQYVDAATSRSKSGSPTSANSRHNTAPPRDSGSAAESVIMVPSRVSTGHNVSYCDTAVQTDPEPEVWYKDSSATVTPRRRFVSLSKRLLETRHRLRGEAALKQQAATVQTAFPVTMEVDAGADLKTPIPSPNLSKGADKTALIGTPALSESDDTPMPDAPSVSPTTTKPNGISPSANPLKLKSPDLRVQMPPVPAFGSPTASVPSTATTPLSAGGSVVQSPFSTGSFPSPFGLPAVNGLANPSPVKKKLSLSDYTKSRLNKGVAGRPSIGTTMLKPMTSSEDPRSATSADGGSVLGSPTAEKLHDTPATAAASTSATAPAAP